MGLEKIGELRKIKKMTLEELSTLSGISVSALKKISAGITTNPSLDTMQAIAKALDCSLDDFDDSPKPEYNFFLFKDEKELIKKYRSLNDSGKEMIDLVLDKEFERICEQQAQEATETVKPTQKKSCTTMAACGGNDVEIRELNPKQTAAPEESKKKIVFPK